MGFTGAITGRDACSAGDHNDDDVEEDETMRQPNQHWTSAKRVRRHPVTGVYTTHAARKLRRAHARRRALAQTREVTKDVLWGAAFFISIWVGVLVVVAVGLVLFG